MRGFLLILMLIFSCLLTGCSGKEEKEVSFSDRAEWYEYDSDNLWGIKATVYDRNKITYIFDTETCPFEQEKVKRAFKNNKLYVIQSWNLDDSGVWSDVRNKHYYNDDMPLE